MEMANIQELHEPLVNMELASKQELLIDKQLVDKVLDTKQEPLTSIELAISTKHVQPFVLLVLI
jgi:hypothetical protein